MPQSIFKPQTRRNVCLGCLGLLLGGWHSWSAFGAVQNRGCWLRGAGASGALGQPLMESGNAEIDAFCSSEASQLNRLFGVRPALRYFGGDDSGNAFATSDIVDSSFKDGTVFIGIGLAEQLQSEYRSSSGLPLAAVMAHEWSHIYQFAHNFQSDWDVDYELSADSGAGWYLLKSRGHDALAPHEKALGGFFGRLGNRKFNNFQFHGTPTQRKYQLLDAAGLIMSIESPEEKRKMSISEILGPN